MKLLGSALWWLSEWSGVGLGRFAPRVLGWKVGAKAEAQEYRTPRFGRAASYPTVER